MSPSTLASKGFCRLTGVIFETALRTGDFEGSALRDVFVPRVDLASIHDSGDEIVNPVASSGPRTLTFSAPARRLWT